MIKVAMVRLDAGLGDEFRLAAAEQFVRLFDCHVVGLLFNLLPKPTIAEEGVSAQLWGRRMERAREAGDQMSAHLKAKLVAIEERSELRRFDVFAEECADICVREARTADAFISLRFARGDPPIEDSALLENVLFESGRHVFVATEKLSFEQGFEHAMVAWNSSREAARALGASLPYLERARRVSVVVVGQKIRSGEDAAAYLRNHGHEVSLHSVDDSGRDTATTLLAEIGQHLVDLLVIGGYGHSRLREWLLGGVTYELLRKTPVSMVIAH